jgi:MFS family permease
MFYSISYTFAIFSNALTNEFGWDRSLTSGAYSPHMRVQGLAAIPMGMLSDRYGSRIVMGFNGFLLGFGMILCSQIVHIWQLYVFSGLLIGIGMDAAFSPAMSITAKWFNKRRGLALGIVASGIGLGMLVMSPASSYLMSVYGWQRAYHIFGLTSWTILAPAAFMLRTARARFSLRKKLEKMRE